jgi:hypothetical protein
MLYIGINSDSIEKEKDEDYDKSHYTVSQETMDGSSRVCILMYKGN